MIDPVQNPYIAPESVGTNGTPDTSIKGNVKVGMIITFALIQGIAVLTAVALFLSINSDKAAQPGAPAEPTDWLLPGMGLLFGVGACIAAFIVTKMMKAHSINKFREQSPSSSSPPSNTQLTPQVAQLLGALQARTIVGQAILEGAAVINAVLMMVDGNMIHLAAIGILIAGIAIQLPTASKCQSMIDEAGRS